MSEKTLEHGVTLEITTPTSNSLSSSLEKQSLRHRIREILWDSLDRTPEERKLIFKLDVFILTWAGFTYFSKNLNQNNISNAYVSGMKISMSWGMNTKRLLQCGLLVIFGIFSIDVESVPTELRYKNPALDLVSDMGAYMGDYLRLQPLQSRNLISYTSAAFWLDWLKALFIQLYTLYLVGGTRSEN
ncbi:hypothetical protein HYALB_00002413 [Hymenoscyphus albidus]|uniref:Uncharacterized protein n=1 Tax=Hymenoscyphus albidus TaxID=595503 RepID=A0A9N9LPA9_9HELO|nr:hypothetical protein HYALB_00002413 [Hymenoscyphus albidus]